MAGGSVPPAMTEGVDGRRWQTRGDQAERRDAEPPSNDTGYAMPGLMSSRARSRSPGATRISRGPPLPVASQAAAPMSVRRSLQAIPSVLSRPQRAAASIPSPTTVSRTPNTLATVQRRVEIGAYVVRIHQAGDLGMPDSNPVFAIPERALPGSVTRRVSRSPLRGLSRCPRCPSDSRCPGGGPRLP
jgi:hypothetical protein